MSETHKLRHLYDPTHRDHHDNPVKNNALWPHSSGKRNGRKKINKEQSRAISATFLRRINQCSFLLLCKKDKASVSYQPCIVYKIQDQGQNARQHEILSPAFSREAEVDIKQTKANDSTWSTSDPFGIQVWPTLFHPTSLPVFC